VLPTMDLPLRPALYWPYVTAVSLRRSLRRAQRRRFEARRERERQAREQQPGAPKVAKTEKMGEPAQVAGD
jgi:hypothetical protein